MHRIGKRVNNRTHTRQARERTSGMMDCSLDSIIKAAITSRMEKGTRNEKPPCATACS